MKCWVVHFADADWHLDWRFFYKEDKLVEFLMSDSPEYFLILELYEARDFSDVKLKYLNMLKDRKGFPGVILKND